MKHTALLSAGTPLLVAAAAVFAVGDLNPPAGSVTATGKRLTEIEPRIAINATNTPGDAAFLFRITQPGSYYLTGNVSGVSGKGGIAVLASYVKIDLNGFELGGVLSSPGQESGIVAPIGAPEAVNICNGTIHTWAGNGISGLFDYAVIENVRFSRNGGWGVSVSGSSGTQIRNCVANINGLNFIAGGFLGGQRGTLITNCISASNTGDGIRLSNGSVLSCTASTNTVNGIRVAASCLVASNNCNDNGAFTPVSANILASSSDNRIEGNNCTGGSRGIDVAAAGNFIVRNTSSGAATNWNIGSNNVCGPILDRTAPLSAAIVGNSGTSSLGSTDANANFSY